MVLSGICPLEPNKSRPLAPGAESDPSSARERSARRCPQPPQETPRVSRTRSLLVLLVLAAAAQEQPGPGPKMLQPWLVGLTAVVVFLFIVFVLLIANRLWRIRTGRKQGGLQESPADDRLDRAGFANPAAARDGDEGRGGEEQTRVTAF